MVDSISSSSVNNQPPPPSTVQPSDVAPTQRAGQDRIETAGNDGKNGTPMRASDRVELPSPESNDSNFMTKISMSLAAVSMAEGNSQRIDMLSVSSMQQASQRMSLEVLKSTSKSLEILGEVGPGIKYDVTEKKYASPFFQKIMSKFYPHPFVSTKVKLQIGKKQVTLSKPLADFFMRFNPKAKIVGVEVDVTKFGANGIEHAKLSMDVGVDVFSDEQTLSLLNGDLSAQQLIGMFQTIKGDVDKSILDSPMINSDEDAADDITFLIYEGEQAILQLRNGLSDSA